MSRSIKLDRLKLIQRGIAFAWVAILGLGGYLLFTADGVDSGHIFLFALTLLFGGVGLYAVWAWQRTWTNYRLSRQVLETRTRELDQQIARLRAIHKVANALSETVELPQLLGQGLERVVNALGLDGGQVHLKKDDEDQVMRLSAVFGDNVRFDDSEHTVRVGECVCGEAAAGLEPVFVENAATDPRLREHNCAQGGIPCVASVPLKVKDGSLGVLTVRSCDPHNFAIHDVQLLTTVANFLASAIENARIRSGMEERIAELGVEVRQLAIVQERERIGREMHDGLAQTLGLLNVQIEMVKEATHLGDLKAAEGELALLDAYLSNAYGDVRQALSDLRNTKPKGESFVASLKETVETFGVRNQLEAVLKTENGFDAACLPPLAEVQLQRVVQEALNNIRRHAAASRVKVSVLQHPEGWELAIADDGKGFDVEQVRQDGPGSYGLLTMQERIEGLGGRFGIESSPGMGTKIVVYIPVKLDRSINGSLAHSAS